MAFSEFFFASFFHIKLFTFFTMLINFFWSNFIINHNVFKKVYIHSKFSNSLKLSAIETRPPRLGEDYELAGGNFVRHYQFEGWSFMLCTLITTNAPSGQTACYFIPSGTLLPQGLALIYTHKMRLRFPSGIQKGWYFVIVPTNRMTLANYRDAIRDLDW